MNTNIEFEGKKYRVGVDRQVKNRNYSIHVLAEDPPKNRADRPKNTVSVGGADAQKLIKLMDALDDLDDVQKVHSNADIDAAAYAEADA